ncbi:MAG: DUF3048 domain-containing protein [Chloroflexota bacterium]|nr:DUF3048 domain-containing protein [Chloroflexota bacterium]MDE2918390.1 DUF3048 domain-containing protein [Chloroflexota bacterium]
MAPVAPVATVAAPRPTRPPTQTAAPTAIPSPEPTTPPPTPDPTPTPTPTPPPIRSPLTGLEIDPNARAQRVVAVKIDNSIGARPQSGLSTAGVVYEHVTEGSVTRYTAFFLDSDLDRVGPIRSSRFVDRNLVQQFDALFAHVGASPPVMQDLRSSPVADLDQFFYDETRPYYRISSRPAPFNMYASLPALREAGAQRHPERRGIGGFRFYEEEPDLGPLTHLTIPAGPRNAFQVEYLFDTDTRRWRRSLGGALDIDALTGEALTVENVIAQWVPARLTQFDEDSLGNKSLWIDTTGEGTVSVFRDGMRLDGTWRRASETEVTEFLNPDGSPIELRPGRTWIHLLTGSETVEAL